MANIIVIGCLALMYGAIIRKLILDKTSGCNTCSSCGFTSEAFKSQLVNDLRFEVNKK